MAKKQSAKDRQSEPLTLVSMTGFGRAMRETAHIVIEVEIKSVNHRFLDLTFKLPRVYSQFEGVLRETISQSINRGRVEVYVTRTAKNSAQQLAGFRRAAFDAFYSLYSELLQEKGRLDAEAKNQIVFSLMSRREVMEVSDELSDVATERADLVAALEEALHPLCQMRCAEGKQLRAELDRRTRSIDEIVKRISETIAQQPERLKQRLHERISKLSPELQLDPTRFAEEVAYLVDRADVTEELVRLESHISQFRTTLEQNGGGRKLDFLLQEMVRELNTIASKAQDAFVQDCVVNGKVEVEKAKEQVQNVE